MLRRAFLSVVLLRSLAFAQDPPDGERNAAKPTFWNRSHATGTWGGLRSELADVGLHPDLFYQAHASDVLRGGVRRRATYRHLISFQLFAHLETLLGIEGAACFLDYQVQTGRDGSLDTGDLQVYSNIDSENHQQVAELWLEQVFFDGVLRFKVGKVDANTEFAYVENGLEFLHSSPGFSPTVLSFPSFPDPSTSANVFVLPLDELRLGFGVYDGATQEGRETGSRGPRRVFDDDGAAFWIGEAEWRSTWGELEHPWRVAVGWWHHTGRFDRFDGTTVGRAAGPYATLDVELLQTEHGNVAAFAQWGAADSSVAFMDRHVGGGLRWRGPFAARSEDILGFGASWVRIPGRAGFANEDELAFEAFYRARLTPWLWLQPDVQWIRHPGGAPSSRNAWVATLAFEVSF